MDDPSPETHPGPRPVLLSWSSGKDSAHALHVLREDPSVELRGLLSTLNGEADRVAMHAVRRGLLRAQSRAVGLPLIEIDLPFPCANEQYEAAMAEALRPQLEAGIEAVAFGDLFLEDVRSYREERNRVIGLDSLFPIWGRNTAELAREMVAGGQRAVLTCVDPKQCPREFVGRAFDEALLDELPEAVDPCGERGEFHTFVWDAPAFDGPIAVRLGEIVERGGFVFADVVPETMSAGESD